jgi:hypothetical protein
MRQPQVDAGLGTSYGQGRLPDLHDEAGEVPRPAASRMTVTLDGSDASAWDQRTLMSPIFGSAASRRA